MSSSKINCSKTLSLKNCGIYKLNSVINHIGESSTSGHYTILPNDPVNKQFILGKASKKKKLQTWAFGPTSVDTYLPLKLGPP